MKTYKFKQQQQGVALALGIMLLLIVSMIGITSMKSALLQEKMAGSLKNREYADTAALALLTAGENYLYTYYKDSNDTLLAPGTDAIVTPRSNEVQIFKTAKDLSGGYTHPLEISLMDFFRNGAPNEVLYAEPKFMIEDIRSAPGGGVGGVRTVFGETFDGSDGGGNGSAGGSGNGVEVETYRIISKATDSTGNLYVGFESVVSVVTR